MKRITILTALFLLLTISSNFYAQRSTKRFNVLTETENVLKFTPTKIFRGVVELGYEHALGDRASIEVSAGPTFSNVSPFGSGGHGILEQINGFNNTTGSLMGFSFSTGFRFYPIEERWVMNGFYVSPIVGFSRYNYQFEDFVFGQLSAQNGYRQETQFGFLFGTQNWLSQYFGLDMFAGCGLRSVNNKRYYVSSLYNNTTGTFTYEWVPDSFNNAFWFITAGLKVGIGFDKK
jgi:hypothetical protein